MSSLPSVEAGRWVETLLYISISPSPSSTAAVHVCLGLSVECTLLGRLWVDGRGVLSIITWDLAVVSSVVGGTVGRSTGIGSGVTKNGNVSYCYRTST